MIATTHISSHQWGQLSPSTRTALCGARRGAATDETREKGREERGDGEAAHRVQERAGGCEEVTVHPPAFRDGLPFTNTSQLCS
jgi:hypothetical protein